VSVTFVVVLLARLLIPLGTPRYPLPAILAALVVDAADQTIFQKFGGLVDDYQSYNKALDIYYLVIAYASTMRDWHDPVAFGVVTLYDPVSVDAGGAPGRAAPGGRR
jgi:hypothetical protein